MGQRLVITVKKDNALLARIYYHWSAYSESALEEAQTVIDILDGYAVTELEPDGVMHAEGRSDIKDLRLRLIRGLESLGGGVDPDDLATVKQTFPGEEFKKGKSSQGLIAISEKGMEAMQSYSEGDLTINLDTRTIYDDVFWHWGSNFDDAVEQHQAFFENDDDCFSTVIPFDFDDLSFRDLPAAIKALQEADQIGYTFRDKTGNCMEMIA